MINIFIAGNSPRCGKDTAGQFFIDKGFKRFALADYLKKTFCEYKEISLEELEENKEDYRDQLIAWGGGARLVDKNFWCKQIKLTDDYNVITDLRFLDEWLYFRQEYKFADNYILYIIKTSKHPPKWVDKSERFPREVAHFILHNNRTLNDFYDRLRTVWKRITNRK